MKRLRDADLAAATREAAAVEASGDYVVAAGEGVAKSVTALITERGYGHCGDLGNRALADVRLVRQAREIGSTTQDVVDADARRKLAELWWRALANQVWCALGDTAGLRRASCLGFAVDYDPESLGLLKLPVVVAAATPQVITPLPVPAAVSRETLRTAWELADHDQRRVGDLVTALRASRV